MKYALLLNDMRSSNIENISIVKISDTKQDLVEWYESLLSDPYSDGGWGKVFKKGSPLEWCNPVHDIQKENDYWGGIWQVSDNVQIADGLYKS